MEFCKIQADSVDNTQCKVHREMTGMGQPRLGDHIAANGVLPAASLADSLEETSLLVTCTALQRPRRDRHRAVPNKHVNEPQPSPPRPKSLSWRIEGERTRRG